MSLQLLVFQTVLVPGRERQRGHQKLISSYEHARRQQWPHRDASVDLIKHDGDKNESVEDSQSAQPRTTTESSVDLLTHKTEMETLR